MKLFVFRFSVLVELTSRYYISGKLNFLTDFKYKFKSRIHDAVTSHDLS